MTAPALHILRTDDFVRQSEKTVGQGGFIRNGEQGHAPGYTVRRPRHGWRNWHGKSGRSSALATLPACGDVEEERCLLPCQ